MEEQADLEVAAGAGAAEALAAWDHPAEAAAATDPMDEADLMDRRAEEAALR